MKWQGRQGSGNVQDRRGMSTGRMAAGGGIGTVIILIIVWLLGGDPSQLLNNNQSGTPTEQVNTTAEEDQMSQFVSVVLKDTETIWGKLFSQSNSTYRQPKLVLFRDQVKSACGFASGPFYCPSDEKIYIDLSFCDQLKTNFDMEHQLNARHGSVKDGRQAILKRGILLMQIFDCPVSTI